MRLCLDISGLHYITLCMVCFRSRNGLVAVGCGTEVIVLDSASLNVVANLCGLHKSSVNMVSSV